MVFSEVCMCVCGQGTISEVSLFLLPHGSSITEVTKLSDNYFPLHIWLSVGLGAHYGYAEIQKTVIG